MLACYGFTLLPSEVHSFVEGGVSITWPAFISRESDRPNSSCQVGQIFAILCAREVFCVLPLLSKSHCHLVGAGRGSMVAHHIREPSSAADARGISITVRVGNCRDHISIAVNIDAA